MAYDPSSYEQQARRRTVAVAEASPGGGSSILRDHLALLDASEAAYAHSGGVADPLAETAVQEAQRRFRTGTRAPLSQVPKTLGERGAGLGLAVASPLSQVGRGMVNTGIAGPAGLVDLGVESTLGFNPDLAGEVSSRSDEFFAADPAAKGSFWRETIPQGAGSLAAFALPGALATKGAAAMGASARVIRGIQVAAPMAMGGISEGGAGYTEAKSYGATLGQAAATAGIRSIVGLSEGLPVSRYAKRLGGGTTPLGRRAVGALTGKVTRAGIATKEGVLGGIEEGAQELFQGWAGNATAVGVGYDMERDTLEGVGEGGAAGGILGFAFSAGMSALGLSPVKIRRLNQIRESAARRQASVETFYELGIEPDRGRQIASLIEKNPEAGMNMLDGEIARVGADKAFYEAPLKIDRMGKVGTGARQRAWKNQAGVWMMQREDEVPWAAPPQMAATLEAEATGTQAARADTGRRYEERPAKGGGTLRIWEAGDGQLWMAKDGATPMAVHPDLAARVTPAKPEAAQAAPENELEAAEKKLSAMRAKVEEAGEADTATESLLAEAEARVAGMRKAVDAKKPLEQLMTEAEERVAKLAGRVGKGKSGESGEVSRVTSGESPTVAAAGELLGDRDPHKMTPEELAGLSPNAFQLADYKLGASPEGAALAAEARAIRGELDDETAKRYIYDLSQLFRDDDADRMYEESQREHRRNPDPDIDPFTREEAEERAAENRALNERVTNAMNRIKSANERAKQAKRPVTAAEVQPGSEVMADEEGDVQGRQGREEGLLTAAEPGAAPVAAPPAVEVEVYHGGTVTGEFDPSKSQPGTTELGPGGYFGGFGTAEEWAKERGGKIGKYKVTFKNPFDERTADASNPNHAKVIDAISKATGLSRDVIESNYGDLGTFTWFAKILSRKTPGTGMFGSGADVLNKIIRDSGFDGIIAKFRDDVQYVAFDKSQIKRIDGTPSGETPPRAASDAQAARPVASLIPEGTPATQPAPGENLIPDAAKMGAEGATGKESLQVDKPKRGLKKGQRNGGGVPITRNTWEQEQANAVLAAKQAPHFAALKEANAAAQKVQGEIDAFRANQLPEGFTIKQRGDTAEFYVVDKDDNQVGRWPLTRAEATDEAFMEAGVARPDAPREMFDRLAQAKAKAAKASEALDEIAAAEKGEAATDKESLTVAKPKIRRKAGAEPVEGKKKGGRLKKRGVDAVDKETPPYVPVITDELRARAAKMVADEQARIEEYLKHTDTELDQPSRQSVMDNSMKGMMEKEAKKALGFDLRYWRERTNLLRLTSPDEVRKALPIFLSSEPFAALAEYQNQQASEEEPVGREYGGEPEDAREPWQIPLGDFGGIIAFPSGDRYFVSGPAKAIRIDEGGGAAKAFTSREAAEKWLMATHKKAVRQAVKDGRDVPADVLEDYKDEPWAKKSEKAAEPTSTAPAFTRTTPAKGTPEREALEAENKKYDEITSKLYDQGADLQRKIEASKMFSKKRDELRARADKLEDKTKAEVAKGDASRKASYRALLEDVAEMGDEANRISALDKLGGEKNGAAFQKIQDLARAEAIAQGVPEGSIGQVVGDAAIMISSYPGRETLEKQVQTSARIAYRDTIRNRAFDEIGKLPNADKDERRRILDRAEGGDFKSMEELEEDLAVLRKADAAATKQIAQAEEAKAEQIAAMEAPPSAEQLAAIDAAGMKILERIDGGVTLSIGEELPGKMVNGLTDAQIDAAKAAGLVEGQGRAMTLTEKGAGALQAYWKMKAFMDSAYSDAYEYAPVRAQTLQQFDRDNLKDPRKKGLFTLIHQKGWWTNGRFGLKLTDAERKVFQKSVEEHGMDPAVKPPNIDAVIPKGYAKGQKVTRRLGVELRKLKEYQSKIPLYLMEGEKGKRFIVNAEMWETATKMRPNATAMLIAPDAPIVFVENGKPVALVMPIKPSEGEDLQKAEVKSLRGETAVPAAAATTAPPKQGRLKKKVAEEPGDSAPKLGGRDPGMDEEMEDVVKMFDATSRPREAMTVRNGKIVTEAEARRIDDESDDSAPEVRLSTVREDQTESEAFSRWFGKSKVVDAEGRPLVVYRGDPEPVFAFDKGKRGLRTEAASARQGFFFTSSKAVADGYRYGDKFDVTTLQKTAERLERVAQRSGKNEDWQRYSDAYAAYENAALGEDNRANEGVVTDVYLSIQNPLVKDFGGERYRDESYAELVKQARREGRDGAILRNTFDAASEANDEMTDIFVVFESAQIKSATGNSGAFDPANPDIRYSGQPDLFDQPAPRPAMTETRTMRTVGVLYDRWKNGPKSFNIAKTQADLPEHILAQSTRGDRIRGAYDPGTDTVWLVAENLGSPEEALFVAVHETVGHRGLEAILGAEADEFYRSVWNERQKDVVAYARDQKMRTLTTKQRLTAAREWIADRVAAGDFGRGGWFKRLVDMLRRAFARVTGKQATDAQIADLVLAAHGWTERAAGARGERGAGVRMSRTAGGQTGSEAFKRWFGDSKVVDENGEPLVVYHGTTAPEDFSEFSVGESTEQEDDELYRTGSGADPRTFLGSHFAKEAAVASKFAEGLYGEREFANSGGRVYPVYLKITNPYKTSDSGMMGELLDGRYNSYSIDSILEEDGDIDETGEQYESDADYRRDVNERALAEEQNADEPSFELAQDMARVMQSRLEREGFDGIEYKNEIEGGTSYVAFSRAQIKSATGNRGTFDPANPDIRFSKTGGDGPLTIEEMRGAALQAVEDQLRGRLRSIQTTQAVERKAAETRIGKIRQAGRLKSVAAAQAALESRGLAPEKPVRGVAQAVGAAERGGRLRAKVETVAKGQGALEKLREEPLDKPARSIDQVVRRAWREGEKRGKAEVRAKYEALVAELRDERKDLEARQRALDEYIRESLPVRERGTVMGLLKGLATPKTPETRARYFDAAIRAVAEAHEHFERREAIRRIIGTLKQVRPRRDRIKGFKTGKLTARQHDLLGKIEVAITTEQADVERRISELVEAADRDAREMTAAELEEFIILNQYGNLREKALNSLLDAEAELQSIVDAGLMRHEVLEAERRERMEEMRAQAIDEFSGGQGAKTILQRQQEQAKRTILTNIVETLRSYDDMMQSWEWLLDKFSRRSKSGGTLKGPTTAHFRNIAHEARNEYNDGVREQTDMLGRKLEEIYGLKGKKLRDQLNKNSQVVERTGVNSYEKMVEVALASGGTEVMTWKQWQAIPKARKLELYRPEDAFREYFEQAGELPLSQNQAYKLWQWLMDPTLTNSLEANGYNEDTRRELEAFMDRRVWRWAIWQLGEFFPDYYKGVNKVFAKQFYVNLPYNPNYSPLAREFESQREDDPLLGIRSHHGSVISGHLKERVQNNRAPRLLDGDSMLFQHVIQMEHFKAWAEPMREMRSVLGAEETVRVVRDWHGHTAARVLKGFLDDFARGGADRANMLGALDKIRAGFTKAVIGINPVILFKQMTSLPAYAMEMPALDWAAGLADLRSNPVAKAKILLSSPALKARYDQGWERDVILALKGSTQSRLARKRSIAEHFLDLVKVGDAASIIMGGWPVYRYHKGKALAAGKTEAQAHEIAIREFEQATERNQQAGDVKDLAYFQRTQGSLGKIFSMFMTAPASYYRQMGGSVRNLAAGRGSRAENAKRLAIAALVLPALFEAVSAGFDPTPEELAEGIMKAPFAGMFLIRDVADYLIHLAFTGQAFPYSSPLPYMDAAYDFGDALKAKGPGEFVNSMVSGASKFAGIPYEPVSRSIEGIIDAATGETEAPIRRILGFSKSAVKENN